MLPGFVRICSWITLIIGSLTALVGLILVFTEEHKFAAVLTFFFLIAMSATGWFARKYGLKEYAIHRIAKISAIFTLIIGLILTLFMPIILSNLYGFSDSILAIRNLVILFTPMIISAIAIIFSKIPSTEQIEDVEV